MLEIYQIPCLQDNYGFLVHDPETGATATIDTPEVAPINQALAAKGWRLTHILNTHHHFCLLYTSPSPRDVEESRMPSSA